MNTFATPQLLQGALLDWIPIGQFARPVALTLTFKQRVSDGLAAVKIDRISASRNLRFCLNRLNKHVWGNAAHRYGKEVMCLPVMEADQTHRMHYHLLLDRPGRMSDAEFEALIRQCWSQTPWAAVQIDYQANADAGWLAYIAKLRTKSSFGDAIDWENCSVSIDR